MSRGESASLRRTLGEQPIVGEHDQLLVDHVAGRVAVLQHTTVGENSTQRDNPGQAVVFTRPTWPDFHSWYGSVIAYCSGEKMPLRLA